MSTLQTTAMAQHSYSTSERAFHVKSWFRLDLIIGILAALALHAGIAIGGEYFKAQPKPAEAEPESVVMEVMIQPLIEPDEVIVPEVSDLVAEASDAISNEPAPPMQADMPSVAIDSAFVQQMQPPPPQGISASATGAIRIPTAPTATGLQARSANIFDISNLDQLPVATFRARPVHPYEMLRAGIAGKVLVEFVVSSSGDVIEAKAIESSRRDFESPAVQAVLKWKYRPGRKGGVAVDTRVKAWLEFNIQ